MLIILPFFNINIKGIGIIMLYFNYRSQISHRQSHNKFGLVINGIFPINSLAAINLVYFIMENINNLNIADIGYGLFFYRKINFIFFIFNKYNNPIKYGILCF